MAKILVACEESQVVTSCFRDVGDEAWSCDILETSGSHPEWHIHGDVLEVLEDDWDAVIAFPPCTHITAACANLWAQKRADGRMQSGIDFFMKFANAKANFVAIENPVGVMSKEWRKPDQIIQPYHYGHEAQKRTCLWLKNLPLLVPTNIVGKGEMIRYPNGNTGSKWYQDLGRHKDRAKIRSKTFPGIARAMADQWSKVINKEV